MVKSARKVVHPEVLAVLRAKHEELGALSVDECKALIGWTEEPADEDWQKDFTLRDSFGRKIRLLNNPANRPFKRPLADRYSLEHLRGKWALNLETIVVSNLGNVLQGQHRLVGFILAEQTRSINPKQWGTTLLVFEVLVGYGVSEKPEVADTFDLGAGRKLSDVMYRRQKFARSVSEKEQRKITSILSGAIRLVWLRAGGKQISFAPHFPHSEATEFYKEHKGILDSVKTIMEIDSGDGNDKQISSLLSLNYASALHYLMQNANNEQAATKFWTMFGSGEGLDKGNPILTLRQLLVRMDAGSGSKRDEIIGAVIKAWNLWSTNKEASAKEIKVARKKDGDRFILAEFPRIGGLDSPVKVETELTQRQLVILSVLKASKNGSTYQSLREDTGLQVGTLANSIMSETKQGKENPHSLASRQLVQVSEHEPQDGEKAHYTFELTKQGKAAV